jgi:hypothetical protein
VLDVRLFFSSLRGRSAAFYLTNLLSIATAAALALWAVGSNPAWFERHVLPNHCPCARTTIVYETLARFAAVALGLALVVWIRPRLARRFERGRRAGSLTVGCIAAVALALVVCDLFLRRQQARRRLEDEPGLPPMRADITGNYVPIPSSVKDSEVAGRPIRYAIDAHGNRVAALDQVEDPDAPTILFVGESIAQGWGVAYEDSYATLVGRALGVKSVNLSVTGFSNDQAYLRLRDELPRFTHPVAVVSIVVPAQLERNVNDARQRLALVDGRLGVVPASKSVLLTSPLRKLVPYHSDEALPLTRAILRETTELVRRRGARMLFVFTNFGPPCLVDERGASPLEGELFRETGAGHIRIDITPPLMIAYPKEVHPNEKGHLAIASAVVEALRGHEVAIP